MTSGAGAQDVSRTDRSGWVGLAEVAALVSSYIPIAVMVYALLVWPLVFGSTEEELSEHVLGWVVTPPAKDESALKIVTYPTLFIISAVCFFVSGAYRRAPWVTPTSLLLAAFVALATASGVWSAFPDESVKRGALCGIIIATLFFSVFAAQSYGTIAKGVFWTLFTATVLNVAAVVLKPPSPIGYTGIYPHKNFFGFVAALILYFGLHGLTFGSWLYRAAAVPMLVLAPVFLLASGSKTSVGLAGLAPLIGLAICGLRRRYGVPPIVVLLTPVLLLLLTFWLGRAAGLWDFPLLNERLLGSATLTGRTEIWALAGQLIAERPFLGWGYEAVWNMGAEGVVTKRAVGFVRTMPTSHNGYIDIFVQLGAVGLFLLVGFLVAFLSNLGKLIDANARLGWFVASVSVFILLHNNLESDILISSNQLSMMLLMYVFVGLRAVREAEACRVGTTDPASSSTIIAASSPPTSGR